MACGGHSLDSFTFSFDLLLWNAQFDENEIKRFIRSTLKVDNSRIILNPKPKAKYFDDTDSALSELNVEVRFNEYTVTSTFIVKFCTEDSLRNIFLLINPLVYTRCPLFKARLKSRAEGVLTSASFGTFIDLKNFVRHLELKKDGSACTYLGAVFEHDRRRFILKIGGQTRYQFEVPYSTIRFIVVVTPLNEAWQLYIATETPPLLYELKDNMKNMRKAQGDRQSSPHLDDVNADDPGDDFLPFCEAENNMANGDAHGHGDSDTEEGLTRTNQSVIESIYTVHLRQTTFDPNVSPETLVKCNVIRLDFPKKRKRTLSHWKNFWNICRNINRYSDKPIYIGNVQQIIASSLNLRIPRDFIDSFPFSIKYAIECLDSLSFGFYDELAFRQELNLFYNFLVENIQPYPSAVENALHDVHKAISEYYNVNSLELLQRRCYFHICMNKLPDPRLIQVRRCILTPSHNLFLPPLSHLHSRFLRNSNPEYALRVYIKDDNLNMLQFTLSKKGADAHKEKFLQEKIVNTLKRGITIFDRRYEFLGSSTSQLRDIGVILYAQDETGQTAADIRRKIGDVSHITSVAKTISRLGLYFSQSLTYVEVPQNSITIASDIVGGRHPESGKPYVFSDGIGMCSESLAIEITEKLSKTRFLPYSAFQIRYAGAKGMLCVHPTLEGRGIILRESMTKFPSSSSSLEILKTSEPRAVYLNRQIICILEGLGISKEVFLDLERKAFLNIFDSFMCSCKTLQVVNSHSLLGMDVTKMLETNIDFLNEPLFQGTLCLAAKNSLSKIRVKAQIPLPTEKARMLFGVLDEHKVLEKGEVFVQYSENKEATVARVMTGTVLVLRHPCMHPGDVRKFQAVDKPELRHICDCIVFPQVGERPHADELSGGDLDGDEFAIIWHEQLIFPGENKEPMIYPNSQSSENQSSRQITVNDMIRFYVDFMKTESVGTIANAHLALADASRQGVFMPECIELAKRYATALDFAKTGKLEETNPIRPDMYPDFMEKHETKPSYMSEKALGSVFRLCEAVEENTTFTETFCGDEFRNSEVFSFPTWTNFAEQARSDYLVYCRKIATIQRKFGIDNELALVSGLYQDTSKYICSKTEKRDVRIVVNTMVKDVFSEMRDLFYEGLGNEVDDLSIKGKASAWYMVSLQENCQNSSPYYAFPWIMSDVLYEIAKDRNDATTHNCFLKKHSEFDLQDGYVALESYCKAHYSILEKKKLVQFSTAMPSSTTENLTTVCLSLRDEALRHLVLSDRDHFITKLISYSEVDEVSCEIYEQSQTYAGNLYVTFTGSKYNVKRLKQKLLSRDVYATLMNIF